MRLLTTTYIERVAKLPKSGRYIVAQFDEEGVILYQVDRAIAKRAEAVISIIDNSQTCSSGT
jgi:hypothetical protein